MLEFIQNPWVIGIVGGIVSSGALLLFTKINIVGRRKRAAKEKRNAIVVDVDEGNDNWIE